MKNQDKWILASEELPSKSGSYPVVLKQQSYWTMRHFDAETREFALDNKFVELWFDLPEINRA